MPEPTSEAVKALFLQVTDLDPAQRGAFLDAQCAADPDLRAAVDELLRFHDKAENAPDFLRSPAAAAREALPRPSAGETASMGEHEPGADTPVTSELDPGRPSPSMAAPVDFRPLAESGVIIAGRYTLVEKIGEGGMGEVWEAKQTAPVKRSVAVKFIKPGMDSRSVLARFEAERQALAVMDHPNIAKVLDGGLTPDGRPFFVMELVRGVPITEYCDTERLTPRRRLELFVPVCQAIQHAHQKGIIHRDIKPSNVLIARYDDNPVPKVIDFGVAKATGQPLTDETLNTAVFGIVGTPQYMSPEQATFNNFDIDTRTDVYSLGVLLYELLTGTTPFSRSELPKRSRLEILRVVREDDPPRPSSKLSTDSELPALSAKRATEPKKLKALLRSELDWIILRALEKDRSRRYESANALAADVNRFLAGEPVLAHPPGGFYVLKKFLGKHKGSVAAVASVAAALLIGLVAFAWQARIARQERDSANAARAETKERADELLKVSDFQAQMLSQIDPTAAGLQLSGDVRAMFDGALAKAAIPQPERGKQVDDFVNQWSRVNPTDAARQLIDQTILKPAVAAIDKQFAGQPVVAATLRQVLADRYKALGLLDTALALQKQALATRQDALGEEHPDTLASKASLSFLLFTKGNLAEAEPLCRSALEARRRVLGADHPDTLSSICDLGALLKEEGKFSEADTCLREAVEKRRRVLGDTDPDTLTALERLGLLLRAQGKLDEARPYLREVLETRRKMLGDDDPITINSISSLASLEYDAGNRSEALVLFREFVERCRRTLGDAHPETLTAISDLGTILSDGGKPAEAEALLREALVSQQRVLGAEHFLAMTSVNNLAVLLVGQGKFAEAETIARENLERRRRVLGVDHPDTLVSCNVLAFVFRRQSKQKEAEPYVRQALEIARRTLGEDHQDTFVYIHNMGMLLREEGKLPEAEPYLREVVERGSRKLGPEHRTVLIAAINLAGVLVDQNRFSEAATLLSPVEKSARKAFATDEARLAFLLTNLGKARAGLKEFALAEAELTEARELYTKTRGPAHKDTLDCIQAAIDLYSARDAAEPGKQYDQKAKQLKTKLAELKNSEKSR
jgi:eukaryotic-like serine/threonine-protein kinase